MSFSLRLFKEKDRENRPKVVWWSGEPFRKPLNSLTRPLERPCQTTLRPATRMRPSQLLGGLFKMSVQRILYNLLGEKIGLSY